MGCLTSNCCRRRRLSIVCCRVATPRQPLFICGAAELRAVRQSSHIALISFGGLSWRLWMGSWVRRSRNEHARQGRRRATRQSEGVQCATPYALDRRRAPRRRPLRRVHGVVGPCRAPSHWARTPLAPHGLRCRQRRLGYDRVGARAAPCLTRRCCCRALLWPLSVHRIVPHRRCGTGGCTCSDTAHAAERQSVRPLRRWVASLLCFAQSGCLAASHGMFPCAWERSFGFHDIQSFCFSLYSSFGFR